MTVNSQQAIERIAIFGAGVVALFAAIAVARSSPRTRVLLVRTPPHPAALADRLPATLPINGPLLDRLELDGEELIARGAAVHRLGERFAGWGERVGDWAQGFGAATPLGLAGAPHQLWLAAAARSRRGSVSALYPASTLAAAARYADPPGSGSALGQVEPALRFDPRRLEPMLADRATRVGVAVLDGMPQHIERSEDGVCAAIMIDSDRRIAADFYIDATGPDAPLLVGLGARRISWSESLPVDRLLLNERPSAADPADGYAGHDLGWRATWSLGDRAAAGLGFRADAGSERRAQRVADKDCELIPVTNGRLDAPWIGNVLAIGDAAAATGPLGGAGLALALLQIELLLELWPARTADPLLVAEYNRRAALRADRVHDWLAGPYLVAPRRKGEFWQAMKGVAMPVGLARTVEQFSERGSVPHHEEECFSRDDWAQRLIGLGVRPTRHDPIASSADPDVLEAALSRAEAATAALRTLPSYPAYLASRRESRPL